MISKLVLHLSKQDASCIHIRLGQNIAFAFGISSVQKPQNSNSLHHTCRGISQELTSRFEAAVDPDVVLGSHVEVAGFWGVVGCLLGDVVAFCVVRELPVAGERLAEDWVEGLLDTSANKHISRYSQAPRGTELTEV